jgi:hypothetical protein
MRTHSTLAHIALFLVATAPCAAEARAPLINANLYTTYQFASNNQALSWVTCGATQGSEGCFGSGEISPFDNICAVLEGSAKIKGDTVTQDIYIFDKVTGKSPSLYLDVYKKTDVITESYDTTTFTQTQHVNLQLPASGKAACYAAAGPVAIYAATSTSQTAVQISKTTFGVFSVGGFSPPETVTGIQADSRGYVSINFTGGFYLFGPTGAGEEDGGGNALLLNETSALVP